MFFQAEDGIRDIGVTGVQTCALPISCSSAPRNMFVAGWWTARFPCQTPFTKLPTFVGVIGTGKPKASRRLGIIEWAEGVGAVAPDQYNGSPNSPSFCTARDRATPVGVERQLPSVVK